MRGLGKRQHEERRAMVQEALTLLRRGEQDKARIACETFYQRDHPESAMTALEVLQTVVDLEGASTVQGIEVVHRGSWDAEVDIKPQTERLLDALTRGGQPNYPER